MSKLDKDSLMRVYPSVLDRDKLFNRLGTTMADKLSSAFTDVMRANIYDRIEELDEGVLDILANDFNIAWYDYDLPVETKRKIVKDSYYVHSRLGTIGSAKKAISDIYPNATFEEWFEYGGDPYCFRISIPVTEEHIDVDKVIKLLKLYKPARAHVQDESPVCIDSIHKIIFDTYMVRYRSTPCGTPLTDLF